MQIKGQISPPLFFFLQIAFASSYLAISRYHNTKLIGDNVNVYKWIHKKKITSA